MPLLGAVQGRRLHSHEGSCGFLFPPSGDTLAPILCGVGGGGLVGCPWSQPGSSYTAELEVNTELP